MLYETDPETPPPPPRKASRARYCVEEMNKLSLACHESSQNSLEHITDIQVEINLAPVSSTHNGKKVWLISKAAYAYFTTS